MKWKINILLAAITVLLGLGFALRLKADKVQTLPKDRYLKLSFEIKQEPRISGNWQIIRAGDLAIFSEYYPRYRVGDVIRVDGMVDDAGRLFKPNITVEENKASFRTKLSKLRNFLVSKIDSLLPSREASLVSGMLLGSDKIDRTFREQLIATGTIHVVVVSGQNLSIVAAVFLSLAAYIGRRWSLGAAFVAIVFYAILSGFEPPVIRAMIMVTLASVAILTGREAAPVWFLIIAALGILFVWPRALFDVSFQLTFAATLGIVTLGNFLSKKLKKLPILGQNAAIASSAFLFTAPVIYTHFERISPVSPLVNVLIAETVFPIMLLGFIALALSIVFTPLAMIFAYLAYVPALFFTSVVGLVAQQIK